MGLSKETAVLDKALEGELRRRVLLLKCANNNYLDIGLLLFHITLLVFTIVMAPLIDHSAWLLFSGTLLGMVMVQIGLIAHDIGHGQVLKPLASRHRMGLLCWNLLLGISYAWWLDKHRRHHRQTHVIGQDPDLYSIFIYDENHSPRLTGFRRFFIAHQGILFWLLVPLARIYFQLLSIIFLFRRPSGRNGYEAALIVIHHVGFWAATLSLLGTSALIYIAVSYWVAGLYMGLIFSTNHLGLPPVLKTGTSTIRAAKFCQLAVTRNIKSGPLGDYLFGGLNYQIEHHLFPGMNRHHLRRIQPTLRRFCIEYGLPYHETGFFQALKEIYRGFRSVSHSISKKADAHAA